MSYLVTRVKPLYSILMAIILILMLGGMILVTTEETARKTPEPPQNVSSTPSAIQTTLTTAIRPDADQYDGNVSSDPANGGGNGGFVVPTQAPIPTPTWVPANSKADVPFHLDI